MKNEYHIYLLYFAGAGQIFIALIYNWVRKILDWDNAVAAMPTRMNQQITQTYSRYIQGLNFAFGLTTILLAPAFITEPQLGGALALILTLYWGGRAIIALTYYDVKAITARRPLFRWGNDAFTLLFACLAIIYGFTAYRAWAM